MMYTVEIYRIDRRTKTGERLVLKQDIETDDRNELEDSVKGTLFSNERCVIRETMMTRINAMSGKEYQERYDASFSCSPRSDAYWSM